MKSILYPLDKLISDILIYEKYESKRKMTMAEVQKKTNLDYINEIWNIADYVRGVISRADYNKAVLPFTLLRRLECALEPTRAAVCNAVKEHEKNWGRESDNYCQYSGKTFYNVIPFKLNNLGAGDAYVALDSYINGFSPNARNIMLKFDMESTCKKLQDHGMLYSVCQKFSALSFDSVTVSDRDIISYIKTKCTAIDTAIEKKKTAIEKWEEYKKALIYYVVTGKIDYRNEVV